MTKGHLWTQRLPLGFDSEEALMEFLERFSIDENEKTLVKMTSNIKTLQYCKKLLENVIRKQKKRN